MPRGGSRKPGPGAKGEGEIDILWGTALTRTKPNVAPGVEYVPGFDAKTGVALAQLGSQL